LSVQTEYYHGTGCECWSCATSFGWGDGAMRCAHGFAPHLNTYERSRIDCSQEETTKETPVNSVSLTADAALVRLKHTRGGEREQSEMAVTTQVEAPVAATRWGRYWFHVHLRTDPTVRARVSLPVRYPISCATRQTPRSTRPSSADSCSHRNAEAQSHGHVEEASQDARKGTRKGEGDF